MIPPVASACSITGGAVETKGGCFWDTTLIEDTASGGSWRHDLQGEAIIPKAHATPKRDATLILAKNIERQAHPSRPDLFTQACERRPADTHPPSIATDEKLPQINHLLLLFEERI